MMGVQGDLDKSCPFCGVVMTAGPCKCARPRLNRMYKSA
jgi:hypothetical protein